MLDEAALALLSPDGALPNLEDDSNLLDSVQHQEHSGQRDIDSDEMNEEMMDEYSPAVVPGWKISDESEAGASETTDH